VRAIRCRSLRKSESSGASKCAYIPMVDRFAGPRDRGTRITRSIRWMTSAEVLRPSARARVLSAESNWGAKRNVITRRKRVRSGGGFCWHTAETEVHERSRRRAREVIDTRRHAVRVACARTRTASSNGYGHGPSWATLAPFVPATHALEYVTPSHPHTPGASAGQFAGPTVPHVPGRSVAPHCASFG
jgi:hypothetical protein